MLNLASSLNNGFKQSSWEHRTFRRVVVMAMKIDLRTKEVQIGLGFHYVHGEIWKYICFAKPNFLYVSAWHMKKLKCFWFCLQKSLEQEELIYCAFSSGPNRPAARVYSLFMSHKSPQIVFAWPPYSSLPKEITCCVCDALLWNVLKVSMCNKMSRYMWWMSLGWLQPWHM